MWTVKLVMYICLSMVHIVFFATESFNSISFHALSYSRSTKSVKWIQLVFFNGGKNVCAYSPTIPRGLSHGPNVRACTISKKDVDSGHPKFVYTDRVSKTCNLPTPNQLRLPSRLFFQPHVKLFLKLNYPQVTKQIKNIRFRPFKKYINKIRLKLLQIVTNQCDN